MVTPGQLNRRAQLFEQLAAMIAAGVPLTQALEMTARNRSIGIPRKVLLELTAHLQEGHTFADAMQLVSGQKRAPQTPGIEVSLTGHRAYWLSDFDIALLTAGEESGQLDSTFKLLARYYAARAKMIRDTIAGSIITGVTLHVFLLVFPIGLLIAFVLGIVNSNYSQCLPFIIEKIAVFTLLYGLIWATAFAGQGNRSGGWRAFVESIVSLVPLLRTALKYLAVARLANQLFSRNVYAALSVRRNQRQNGRNADPPPHLFRAGRLPQTANFQPHRHVRDLLFHCHPDRHFRHPVLRELFQRRAQRRLKIYDPCGNFVE
jgi:Type II secretion system (T2SS), protein F